MAYPRQRWEQRYEQQPAPISPSPFVVRHAELIRGRALDVAGGAGRNALFLAQRGVDVDIIDIAAAGLRAAVAAARARQLHVNAIQADLQTYPLPPRVYDAVINIRYLQRSLFAPLRDTLKPGGIVLFETFLIDQQKVGHPRNPDFLLRYGELREAFADFEIIEAREGLLDSDPPAYLAQLAARRPSKRD